MPASSRRIGATTSKTRDTLLECVERMMLADGYASISYRTLAAKAGVTASLVQYYFPTLDDVFLAAIRRYADRNLEVLGAALESPGNPLTALWEFSWDEATSALMIEFMALANHRKSIRAEIAEVAERVRTVEVDALAPTFEDGARFEADLPLGALVLLITGVPKFLTLEEGVGVETAHAELIGAFERHLASMRPNEASPKTKRQLRARR